MGPSALILLRNQWRWLRFSAVTPSGTRRRYAAVPVRLLVCCVACCAAARCAFSGIPLSPLSSLAAEPPAWPLPQLLCRGGWRLGAACASCWRSWPLIPTFPSSQVYDSQTGWLPGTLRFPCRPLCPIGSSQPRAPPPCLLVGFILVLSRASGHGLCAPSPFRGPVLCNLTHSLLCRGGGRPPSCPSSALFGRRPAPTCPLTRRTAGASLGCHCV